MNNRKLVASAIALTVGIAASASASSNLVQNGDFEITTVTNDLNGVGPNGLANWTNGTGPAWLVFADKIAPGAPGTYGTPIWSPSSGGVSNGLIASPTGGNFLAIDGDATYTGPLTQTIDGLVAGETYALQFYSAGGQLYGQNGPTTESWRASLGTISATNLAQSTTVLSNDSHGFTGWTKQYFVFTAYTNSEVLTFFAIGTPQGIPPMSLLDGVSLTAVPEPATWGMMIAGFVLTGLAVRRRKIMLAA